MAVSTDHHHVVSLRFMDAARSSISLSLSLSLLVPLLDIYEFATDLLNVVKSRPQFNDSSHWSFDIAAEHSTDLSNCYPFSTFHI